MVLVCSSSFFRATASTLKVKAPLLSSLFVSALAFSSRPMSTHRTLRDDSYGGSGATLQPVAGSHTSTVIWLHGLGDTAMGWLGGIPHNKFPNTRFIFPTAPIRPITLNGGFPMTGWFDITGLDAKAPEDKPGFDESKTRLDRMIDGEVAAGVPLEKIVLGGFSQGGAMVYYTVLRGQRKLAGGVVLSGWLAFKDEYPGCLTDVGKQNKFFHGHGDSDDIVRYSWGKGSVDALKSFGVDISMETYQDLGHGATPDEIESVVDFITQAIR